VANDEAVLLGGVTTGVDCGPVGGDVIAKVTGGMNRDVAAEFTQEFGDYRRNMIVGRLVACWSFDEDEFFDEVE
jgi:hypothetical protein